MGLYNSGFSDDFISKGYLSKEEILSYATESQIFYMVFGFFPKEYQYTISPFREDTSPGAYFENMYDENRKVDKMYFVDWADPNQVNRDCFDCVRDRFNLQSFYHTLDFIKENLIIANNLKKTNTLVTVENTIKKKKSQILFKPRRFMDQDKTYWMSYGISKRNLIDDDVFPVSKYLTKKGDISYMQSAYTLTYAYNGFSSGNVKLYFPFKKKGEKFRTTCTQNDIGGLKFLFDLPKLVITKSYKDFRVLKNAGCNVIWFQNEGMIPKKEIILNVLKISKFKEIFIFFDNDDTGIKAAIKVANHINELLGEEIAIPINLPESFIKRGVTDPADLRKIGGKERLKHFLYKNNLI